MEIQVSCCVWTIQINASRREVNEAQWTSPSLQGAVMCAQSLQISLSWLLSVTGNTL